MKFNYKTAIVSLMALLAITLLGTTIARAGDQDFTLVNDTGVEVHHVYIAPHSSDDWGDDVLGEDTLEDGASVDIKFSRKEKAALWDLKIEDKGGNTIEWEKLNLLEISKVTIHYKNGKGTASVE
jgi:hypothetical protein